MNSGDHYGTLDRILYRLAFRLGTAQHALADVEKMLYKDELESIAADNPVFISSLPRSGTTILLKLLRQTGEFASHTFQDMPFVLCPMLWRRFSRPFAEDLKPTERAHEDGLLVSGESPAALEEMIWKHFWPGYYRTDRIQPWQPGEKNLEFERFFDVHMRKVIAICLWERTEEATSSEMRYLSKNNLNIARLAAPPKPLRKGRFLIPFRAPVQQAASMLHQHRRFLKIHEEDSFIRAYMEAIGHHEFGKGLRPVNFEGWLEKAPTSPSELPFWMHYWTVAYRFVLKHAGDQTTLISYARLTEKPKSSLSRLAEAVDLPSESLVSQTDQLHPPRNHSICRESLPKSLLREASEIYQCLEREAVV